MDKTLNKLLMVVVGLVIFDATGFDLHIEKSQFQFLGGAWDFLVDTGKMILVKR